MRLNNLRLLYNDGLHDLVIHNGKITAIQPSRPKRGPGFHPEGEAGLDFEGSLVFPGLINSHDHLDFNLFPPLANRIYNNYREWGPDIRTNNRAAIDPILAIPQSLRTRWGIYKNLLNGFTTVVNHGEPLDIDAPFVTVFQDCYCLHSVGFERNWKWKLNHPARSGRPFAIHAGEGTDVAATREIDALIRWNIFRRPLIGIHGVAMTVEQASSFRALVWCPASNHLLLDKTAAVDCLRSRVPILFGTDSTLTSGWNAWQQIRMARELRLVTDAELFDMLTVNPAAAWGLHDRGMMATGKRADLVIARPKSGACGLDAFFSLGPEDFLLVLHEGRILLFDAALLNPITENQLTAEDFQPTRPNGKYVVGDLPALMQEIRRYCPDIQFQGMVG
ncbi:MAG TPA: amidohydrolase family protein [Puia sp.]|nr:amidohydrolase family protein [Puia sp.]